MSGSGERTCCNNDITFTRPRRPRATKPRPPRQRPSARLSAIIGNNGRWRTSNQEEISLHTSEIPTATLERMNARRGGPKPTIADPAKTAHIVIDLQVGFLAAGAISEVPVAREIVPNV